MLFVLVCFFGPDNCGHWRLLGKCVSVYEELILRKEDRLGSERFKRWMRSECSTR